MDSLVDAGDWSTLACELLEATARSADDVGEHIVCELVARGRLESVRHALEHAPASDSLFRRLVVADARARVNVAELRDLEALLLEVREADAPVDWEIWATATLLNAYGLSGTPSDLMLASDLLQHSDLLDMSKPLSRLGRIYRAQVLQPAAAALALSMSPGSDSLLEAQLCLDELSATGCWEEHAYAVARFGMAIFTVQPDRAPDVLADYDYVVETMQRTGSYRWRIAELARGWIALDAGYFETASESFRRARLVPVDDGLSRMAPGMDPDILEPLLRIARGAALERDLTDVADRLEALRATAPYVSAVAHLAAKILLDQGFTEAVRRVIPPADVALTLPWGLAHMLRITHGRLDLQESGDERALAAVLAMLHEYESHGLSFRDTAVEMLRVARDCRRCGLRADADRLRSEALARLPQLAEMTEQERRYATWAVDDDDRPSPTTPQEAGVDCSLRFLGAAPEFHASGSAVSLGPVAVHLLAVLVGLRRPVTTDWLLESLWPYSDPKVTKQRLGSLLFRIRRQLRSAGATDLVVRTVDGVRLATEGKWRIDAWEFWDLSFGTDAERHRALALYRGDFCAGLFEEDEVVDSARNRLRRRFVQLACELLETDADASDVIAHVAAVGVSDDRLDTALADRIGSAEVKVGRGPPTK